MSYTSTLSLKILKYIFKNLYLGTMREKSSFETVFSELRQANRDTFQSILHESLKLKKKNSK